MCPVGSGFHRLFRDDPSRCIVYFARVCVEKAAASARFRFSARAPTGADVISVRTPVATAPLHLCRAPARVSPAEQRRDFFFFFAFLFAAALAHDEYFVPPTVVGVAAQRRAIKGESFTRPWIVRAFSVGFLRR